MGASLACAVHAERVALVGPAPRPLQADAVLDSRVYALSPGNVDFLRQIGAWQRIDPARVVQVYGMEVSGDRAGSIVHFDAYDCGVPQLAWIVEDALLQEALWREVSARANVQRHTSDLERVECSADEARVALRAGDTIAAELIVGADGAHSPVRESAGIGSSMHDYRQNAVVANFSCESDHRSIAYQWFRQGAVLALLPLPGKRVSMVWSLPSEEAERIATADAPELCREVESASGGKLGALSLISPPRTYPLRQMRSRRLVVPRVALAGDAAHVIHPLAGQGLNLGLQDARCLADVLNAREEVRGYGDWHLLRRYERERAEPILSMDFMVDGLYRLFGARGGAIGRLRNAGLNLTDRLPVLKNLLMRHAMR